MADNVFASVRPAPAALTDPSTDTSERSYANAKQTPRAPANDEVLSGAVSGMVRGINTRLEADKAEIDAKTPHAPTLSPAPPREVGTDPLQAFGQPAMWLAMFGSLLTRNHLTSAITSAAGVMKATHDMDAEASKQNYEAWKVSSENAIKLAKFEQDAYGHAIQKYKADSEAGTAQMEVLFKAYRNAALEQIFKTEGMQGVIKYVLHADNATELMEREQDSLDGKFAENHRLNAIATDSFIKANGHAPNLKDPGDRAEVSRLMEEAKADFAAKAAGGKAAATGAAKANTKPETYVDESGTPFQHFVNADRTVTNQTIGGEPYEPKGQITKVPTGQSQAVISHWQTQDKERIRHNKTEEGIQTNRNLNDQQKAAALAAETKRWHDVQERMAEQKITLATLNLKDKEHTQWDTEDGQTLFKYQSGNEPAIWTTPGGEVVDAPTGRLTRLGTTAQPEKPQTYTDSTNTTFRSVQKPDGTVVNTKVADGQPYTPVGQITKVAGGENATTGARRDRELAERERHNGEIERISNDRNLTTEQQTDARQTETNRHNQAMEKLGEDKREDAKEARTGYGKPQQIEVENPDGSKRTVVAQQSKTGGGWVTADEKRTPIDAAGLRLMQPNELAPPKPGTAAYERANRFSLVKQRQIEDGSYKNDLSVYDEVNREMFLSKSASFTPGTAEMIADQIIAGNSAAASGFGRSPQLLSQLDAALLKRMNEHHPPLTGADMARIKVEYAAYTQGTKAFEAGGSLEPVRRSLNVVVEHLGTLDEAIAALSKNDTTALNRAMNFYKQQTGYAGPTTFDAIRGLVAGEINKAVTSSGGAVSDREDLKEQLNRSMSPDQISSAIKAYEALMGGQIGGLRLSYDRVQELGGQPKGRFDERYLSEKARSVLVGRPSGLTDEQIIDKAKERIGRDPSARNAVVDTLKGWGVPTDGM